MTKEHAENLALAIVSADVGAIADALMVAFPFPEDPVAPVDANAGRCKSNMWSEKTGNLRCKRDAGHLPVPCDFGLKVEQ